MIHFVGPQAPDSKFPNASVGKVLDYFTDKDEIQVDSETSDLDPHIGHIITLQLGDRHNQFVIDSRHVNLLYFKELLETKRCLLHNGKFDYKVLRKNNIIMEHIYDTMLSEIVIYNGYDDWGFGLEALVKRYLNIELEKQTRDEFSRVKSAPLTDKQINYAGTDVIHLQDVRDRQLPILRRWDLEYAAQREHEALKALADIEYNGMYLNSDKWTALAKKKQEEAIERELELDDYLLSQDLGYRPTGEQDLFGAKTRKLKLNYNSPPQTLDMLRRNGLPVNDTNANTLLEFSSTEVVKRLTAVREVKKKVSTYGEDFLKHINPATGRIHTDFWQIKHTYRLGSSDPNVQNIPSSPEYRACFEPRPGYKWISLDYSGQEMRLMADFSNEQGLIQAMNEGKDPHCFVGSMMFGKEIKKGDPERQDAKSVNFGKPYGMGAPKLAGKLQSSVEVAEDRLRLHEKAFPNLDHWLKRQGKLAIRQGYTLVNHTHKGRRWFPDIRRALELRRDPHPDWSQIMRIEGRIERAAMNLSIQGTGAVMMKEALIAAREIIRDYDAYLICTVHDQVDIEAREDQAQEIHDRVKAKMTEIGNQYVKYVQMPVDGQITDVWKK